MVWSSVTLIATGGELPVVFNVDGVDYSVDPDTTARRLLPGTQRRHHSHRHLRRGRPICRSTSRRTCDLPPLVDYVQKCANFDDTVSVLIENQGDDVDVTFTINGTDYVLAPGESQTVLVDHLADGSNTITVAIDGVPQNDIVVESNCDPVVTITPVCNSVDTEGAITEYWFTIANSESHGCHSDAGMVAAPRYRPGRRSRSARRCPGLVLRHNGGSDRSRLPQPVPRVCAASPSPRSCRVSRRRARHIPIGSRVSSAQTYVEELTFNINGGETKTVNLPSTLDPAGIDYKFEEIVIGTANTQHRQP